MSERASNDDPEVDALLERMAAGVVKYGMALPAVLFLEGAKPLNFVGSQLVGFFEPTIRILFQWNEVEKLREALEHRDTIDRLLGKIEDHDQRRKAEPKA